MTEDTPTQAPRHRKPFRLLLWVVLGGLLLVWLMNIFGSDLDLSGEDRIAVIRVEGVILDAQQTVGDLKKFAENPTVKAIVLRIDSPGGGVVPSQEIHDAVKRVRNKNNKAVIASMGTVAASGGYYIAAAADRIIANPGTLTGSIGVIMELANLEGLLKKIGVESVVVKSGQHKDLGSPFRKMSEGDRHILQSVMDDVHDQFIEAVAEGRSLDIKDVRPLADGRIFTGRQAKDIKLVDELGDLEDAIRLAADMAGIEGEPKVVEPRKRFSIRDLIESHLFGPLPRWDFQTGVNLKYLMAF
ncbi:MAG TPA: signal peptide peptidase SppA [Nitrospiraceae bacterium]|jgi:protease-4|nr:signal peptide peptidase SppA [Nitrospiraceae bacterium]